MENGQQVLQGYSDLEKGAYLGAIASLATADRQASQEEIEHIEELCEAAQLSPQQKEHVVRASTELSGEELNRCLDILKGSELKYSLVTDLIAFAKADDNYSEEEEQNVQKISQYLGVNQQQFSLLDQFAEKAVTTDAPPEEVTKPSFLSSLGLQDKLSKAGINTNGLLKGLLGFAGPMILGGLVGRAMGRRRTGLGGGGLMSGGGGLGSLIGMLSGGRGFGNTGGLLGRMLGGRRSFFTILIFAGALYFSGCKDKAKDTTTTPIETKTDTNSTTTGTPEISTDAALEQGVKDATKDYPGVTATVSNGEVTLTGTIERDKVSTLLQSVNGLNPRKVNNQLTYK